MRSRSQAPDRRSASAATSSGSQSCRSFPLAVYLLVGVWAGLAVGLGESSLAVVRKFVLHEAVQLSPHVVWMAPLVEAAAFGMLGAAVALAAWRWDRAPWLKVLVFVATFLGFMALNWAMPKLATYAAVLLGIGLAVQAVRSLGARPHRLFRLVRWTGAWLAAVWRPRSAGPTSGRDDATGADELLASRRQFVLSSGSVVAGLVLGTNLLLARRERRSLAAIPLIQRRAERPNVVLIVLDTVRAQSLSLYGRDRATSPSMESFAGRGARFDMALSTSPWTLPSHASMFTGRFPHELKTSWLSELGPTYPTLAEFLSARGYLSAGFAANIAYCSYEHGLDRGFAHYEDYRVSPGQALVSAALPRYAVEALGVRRRLANHENFGRKSAEHVGEDFRRWVTRKANGRPFFAFLNYYDAHDPYLPPRDIALRFGDERPLGYVPNDASELSEADVQQLRVAYHASIAYIDQQLGALLEWLDASGLLDDTIVILTSDHGEQFGEHGLLTHGNSVYLPAVHVPLIVVQPWKIPAGLVVRDPVSLRDVPATVLDALGAANDTFPGSSLARHWSPSAGEEARMGNVVLSEVLLSWDINGVPTGRGPLKGLTAGSLRYIRNPDGREELYDYVQDPAESLNLVDLEEYGPSGDRFRAALPAYSQNSVPSWSRYETGT